MRVRWRVVCNKFGEKWWRNEGDRSLEARVRVGEERRREEFGLEMREEEEGVAPL
jgi:hypothetical protein